MVKKIKSSGYKMGILAASACLKVINKYWKKWSKVE